MNALSLSKSFHILKITRIVTVSFLKFKRQPMKHQNILKVIYLLQFNNINRNEVLSFNNNLKSVN